MECCQVCEMHQWEEKKHCNFLRKRNNKGKSKVFSLDHHFALISWETLKQVKDGTPSAACVVSAAGKKRGLVSGKSPKIHIQCVTGTTSFTSHITLTKHKLKALCLPQLLTNFGVEKTREVVSWVHFSWWRCDDWWERSVSGHLMNSSTEDYFMPVCHMHELKRSLWNIRPHYLEHLLPHVDIKPMEDGGRISCIWHKSRNRPSLQFHSSIDQSCTTGWSWAEKATQ